MQHIQWTKGWLNWPLDGNVVTWNIAPSVRNESNFACCGHPVIYGVMDVDWHYYLLIAPYSSSSPFEDQSGRVSLCVPTLIKPKWTSIKLTVHFVHLPLLTLSQPDKLNAAEPEQSTVQHFMMIAQNNSKYLHNVIKVWDINLSVW